MDKFTFFRSYIDAIEDLPSDEFKKIVIAICRYALDDETTELTGAAKVAYKLITPILDNGKQISEARSEAGKKGNEKRWGNSKTSQTHRKPSQKIANDRGIGEGIGIGKGIGEGIGEGIGKEITNVISPSKPDPYVEKWNSLGEYGIAPIKLLTEKRKQSLKARLRQYGEESFNECIEQIKDSDFLQGKHGGKEWQVTFDWMICPNNYPKVLEGNYKNRNTTNDPGGDFLLSIINGGKA